MHRTGHPLKEETPEEKMKSRHLVTIRRIWLKKLERKKVDAEQQEGHRTTTGAAAKHRQGYRAAGVEGRCARMQHKEAKRRRPTGTQAVKKLEEEQQERHRPTTVAVTRHR